MNKLISLLFAVSFAHAAGAQTIVEKRLQEQTRLIPLEKITVGPFNNYHADLADDGKLLLYTHKVDLSPYIFVQDLKTGKSRHFLSEREDAEQPTVSADGKKVAFTYYKDRSFGDICYRPVTGGEDKMKCLSNVGQSMSSPFWLGDTRLGYLRTDVITQRREIVLEDLDGGKPEVLARGAVTAPSMSLSGRYLVYTLIENQQRILVIEDRHNKRTRRLRFELPGVSGLPVISGNDEYLYFSQYLNDTNNDQVIDGNDHSVIFRAKISEAFASQEIFPEQLTSVENNCSFPRIRGGRLFVTCAFQGSLDIYSLPESGTVPADWDADTLWSAHRTARTYDERVLLLNSLRYRFPQKTDLFKLRVFSNYLHSGNLNAARYYLYELGKEASGHDRKSEYRAIDILLDVRQRFERLLSGELTPAYLSKVGNLRQELKNLPALSVDWRVAIEGLLHYYTRDYRAAEKNLKLIRLAKGADPILSHLYLQLAQNLRAVGQIKLAPLLQIYSGVLTHSALPVENQVFYSLSWLKQLKISVSKMPERIEWIERSMREIDSKTVQPLFWAEKIAWQIVQASDEKRKQELYGELDKIIRETKDRYYLKRAIYTRSIYVFADAGEFRYLNFIANNWLRFTQKSDTEFVHAREHLVYAIRDRAYSSFARGQLVHADNLFYQALSLTDDLESHYGYIYVMLQEKKKEMLLKQYENLRKRKFLEDNVHFVEAVLLVMEDQARRTDSTKLLEEAVDKLEKMETGFDSAMKALLLGYCQFEILERKAKGYEYNLDLMQETHRNFMLAYDLGKDNARIRASALMNLGLLHLRTQGFRSAIRYLEMRGELPFTDRDEEAFHTYVLARAYYYGGQSQRAVSLLDLALQKGQIPQERKIPFLERRAFYAMAAADYKKSSRFYGVLINEVPALDQVNRVKIGLAYGFSLMRAGDEAQARQVLTEAYKRIDAVEKRSQDEYHLLALDPLKLRLHYSGFLAQLTGGKDRLEWLEKRREFLRKARPHLTELSIKEARWYNSAIRNQLHIAETRKNLGIADHRQAVKAALDLLDELGKSEDLWLGEVFFETSVNVLSYGLLLHDRPLLQDILKVTDRVLEAYRQQKTPSDQIAYQTIKLGLLSESARRKIERKSGESRDGGGPADLWETPAGKAIQGEKVLVDELKEWEKLLKI